MKVSLQSILGRFKRTESSRESNPISERGNLSTEQLLDPEDNRFDGYVIGAASNPHPPNSDIRSIAGVKPAEGNSVGRVVWINGIMSDVSSQRKDMQRAAEVFGTEVVGIHNSTEGMLRDLTQCLKDKTGTGDNPAVETTTTLIHEHVTNPDPNLVPLHIIGHSQGALIASRALKKVEKRLREEGKSSDEISEVFQMVKMTTLGGAGARFPDGPEYLHVVNRVDPVPALSGINGLPGTKPGKDALLQYFSDVHRPDSSQLPSWRHPVQRMARATDQAVHGARHIYLDQVGREWNLSV